MRVTRLVPTSEDADTGPYWQAAREHRLTIAKCSRCDKTLHLPRQHCDRCHSTDIAWREVAGRGSLYSWTTTWHPTEPSFEVPYTVVLVDLVDEPEVRLVGSIPGAPTLEPGMPMRVVFEDVPGANAVLPQWRPDTAVEDERP